MSQLTQTNTGFPGKAIEYFTSPTVTLGLFAGLVILLIPSTLFPRYTSLLLIPAKGILALIGLSIVTCTLRKLKTLQKSTLLVHLGTLAVLAGGMASSLGYIATVNVYEGTSIDTVFRWDNQEDYPLGFDLRVARINTSFYPVDVKVGVLKNGLKAELVMSRTENFFVFEGYRVQIVNLDPKEKKLEIAIQSLAGERIGTLSTSGRKDLPSDFPLDFQLIAFRDPVIKRMWADLELWQNGKLLATGISEVNRPFRWQGMRFFLTQVAADSRGRAYAGIQISRDPGTPYVYAGFIILCLGFLLVLKRWAKTSQISAQEQESA